MKYNYLYDKAFLKLINNQRNRTHYVKITVLSLQETPIAAIEGTVTSGSINVNGSSAVRRTGSLSLVATLVDNKEIFNVTDINNLISIEKKIEIEIGLENNTSQYQEEPIIWFPQGQFVITSAAVAHNTQNITISINIKDKMALLNGECGGTLSIGLTHSPLYTILENGEVAKEPVKFKALIRTLVNEYGNIPLNKIIIDNIPDRIKNIVRWTGSYPIYGYTLKDKDSDLSTLILTAAIPSQLGYDTYSFGDSIGYEYTDFVYPTESELSSNAGDTIVSVLDKIKNTLGNFEYFFDLDGNFHFQQIQDYVNEGSSEDTIIDAIESGAIDYLNSYSIGKSVYNFDNNELVTVFNNNPKYEAIKNDICVWGVRGDSKAPLQYHLVIDTVPTLNAAKTWEVVFYEKDAEPGIIRARAPKEGEESQSVNATDYRTMMYYDYIINKSDYTLAYGKELEENWPKIYDLKNNQFKISSFQDSKVFLNNMTYYFEIIDPKDNQGKSILESLKVSKIGRRPKALNDDKVNILLTPMPPDWVYIEAGTTETATKREEAIKNEENFVQLPTSLSRHVALGAQTNSAYDAIRSMLHELISYNESVSLTTIPVYHLEPNTRITAQDQDIGVAPTDYIIKSFSVPLSANGTMTLQCTRALERI